MNENLPPKTVRDLGALFLYFGQLALRGARRLLNTVAPFVRPPDEMEVHCGDGGEYSGVLFIENNVIETGVVVRTGQGIPDRDARQRPWSRPNLRDNEPGSTLAHWALDSRDEEDESWGR